MKYFNLPNASDDIKNNKHPVNNLQDSDTDLASEIIDLEFGSHNEVTQDVQLFHQNPIDEILKKLNKSPFEKRFDAFKDSYLPRDTFLSSDELFAKSKDDFTMNSWSGEVYLDLGSEFHGINTKQANFIELITQKALYIDKTALLEFLDYSCYSCHCLNRPKGCGKTTTIGMIKAFYDISLKDAYDYLFKDLYIYQKKLAHNCYTILEFDFGEISSIDDIAEPIFYALDNFAAKYNLDYQVNRSLPISRNIDLFINNYQRSYQTRP